MSKEKTAKKTAINQARRKRYVEQGLCRCGRERDEKSFKTCGKCREYTRNRRYKHEDVAEQKGLCYLMGCKNPIDLNLTFVSCQSCRDYKSERYFDRVGKGLCVSCQRPTSNGKAYCPTHLEYIRQKQKEIFVRKKKLKRCVDCNSRNLLNDTVRCSRCALTMRDREIKRRKARIAKGLCPCGVNKQNKKGYYCYLCLRKHNRYSRNAKRKTRAKLEEIRGVEPLLLDITKIDKDRIV